MKGKIGIVATSLVAMFLLSGVAAAWVGADETIMPGLQVVRVAQWFPVGHEFVQVQYKVINNGDKPINYSLTVSSAKNISGIMEIHTDSVNFSDLNSTVKKIVFAEKSRNVSVDLPTGKEQLVVFEITNYNKHTNSYNILFDRPGFAYSDSFIASPYDTDLDGKINESERMNATSDYFDGVITRQEAIDVSEAYMAQTEEVDGSCGGGMDSTSYYDFDGDGKIQKNEAVNAILDYFVGLLSRQEAIDIVALFVKVSPLTVTTENNWPIVTLADDSPEGVVNFSTNQPFAKFVVTNPGPKPIFITGEEISMSSGANDKAFVFLDYPLRLGIGNWAVDSNGMGRSNTDLKFKLNASETEIINVWTNLTNVDSEVTQIFLNNLSWTLDPDGVAHELQGEFNVASPILRRYPPGCDASGCG